MTELNKNAREVFNEWALDYHADGMEKGHWQSVQEAFAHIPPSDGNYLEIGIGNGYGINHIAANQYLNGRCTGLDISENMVKVAGERMQDVRNVTLESGDFLTWQPQSGMKFDCIFSMEVFYYLPSINAGIEKAVSLLSPGGMLMVLVNHHKHNPESFSWAEELGTPMILWDKNAYASAFSAAGLTGVRQMFLPEEADEKGTLCTTGIKP